MRVTIKLFSSFRKYADNTSNGTTETNYPDSPSIRDILRDLCIPEDIPRIVLINGQQSREDRVPSDGDTISVFPPIAGG